MIWNNSIWYQVLIDRFAGFTGTEGEDQPKFVGGTLKGIIDKLDYLDDLGIDVLLLSPFTQSAAYHGYHVVNYEEVDPHFGDETDLRNLIALAHQKNIKIIADFVPNHCSKYHPYFINTQNDKQSKYKEWFYYKEWPHNYHCFLDYKELPKLNFHNEETIRYFIDIAISWCKMGIDGIRIDHVIGLPDSFIIRLSKTLKSINSEFILVGEAWLDGLKYKHLITLGFSGKHKLWRKKNRQFAIQKHYENILDGVFDFDKRSQLIDYVSNCHCNKQGRELLSVPDKKYNKAFLLPVFLDNHDVNRFFFLCKENMDLYGKTLKILFNQKQPVILYAGNEIPLSQKEAVCDKIPYSDLNCRQAMRWDDTNTTLRNQIKQLIALKKEFHGNSKSITAK